MISLPVIQEKMGKAKQGTIFFVLGLLHSLMQSKNCSALDSITPSKKISVGDTLTSPGQVFELGFFRPPGNSQKQYVGIWYKNIPVRKVIWVANRNTPIQVSDTAASLAVSRDGNLVIFTSNQTVIWSTNISTTISTNSSTSAVLQDDGNLKLKEVASGEFLWESFRSPGDTIVPEMTIGMNIRTGEKWFISSWMSEDDPSPGNFVMGLSSTQAFIWNNSVPHWRSGEWNGLKHIGVPLFDASELIGFNVVSDNQQGTTYFAYSAVNNSVVRTVTLTSFGSLRIMEWDEGKRSWVFLWGSPETQCDPYNVCGAFGVCDVKKSPICSCLRGYVPKSYEEWSRGNWTGGCVRLADFSCDRKMNNNGSSNTKIQGSDDDGFLKMGSMKLPDSSDHVRFDVEEPNTCEEWCLNNCSCIAYAYVAGIRCMVWTRELIDMQIFSTVGEDLFLRLPKSELGNNKGRTKLLIGLLLPSAIIFLGIGIYSSFKWKANRNGARSKRTKRWDSALSIASSRKVGGSTLKQDSSELPIFDFSEIQTATKNFCFSNKLGEGGFGPVYKGRLQNGQEIAVKRLSNHSGQGLEEFKNEIILVSKLQHRNLARLLGCCIDQEELIIIYEYMSNKSLDTFLFDATKRALLDWPKRFNIIQGIARGLLYLHRDSCLRIIHRDLKVSNILLDESLNPKISDFGLARTFQGTQELAKTHRVIGTFGYMSPEYVLRGTYSEKSDVFSFGVLVLEIISSKKNATFHDQAESLNLLDDAWQLWTENRGLEFIDQTLANSYSEIEVIRCLNVGLLCVQDRAMDRPTMSTVVQMLTSETNRPRPKQPSCISQRCSNDRVQVQDQNSSSTSEMTISMLQGR